MPGTTSVLNQFFCPAKPKFIEKDLPDLTNKVSLPSSTT